MADDFTAELVPLMITPAEGPRLEAELLLPPLPRAAIVIAHPHPQYGGTMLSHVVHAVFKAAPRHGFAALRFNFRGIGLSKGSHDGGAGECTDYLAAATELTNQVPGVPLVLGGYSFGSEVALASDHEASVAWFCVAPVLRMFPAYAAAASDKPKFLTCAEHDSYAPSDVVTKATASWPHTTVAPIAMADHFFMTGTGALADAFEAFAATIA